MPSVVAALLLTGMMATSTAAIGQAYPSKPIRIVTGGTSGAADIAARLVAPGMSELLGQQLIVDNRNGIIPGQVVSSAPADGYTVLVHGATFWIGPLLQSTPYDPIRDFATVSLLVRAPNVLVVHPSLPVKSVKELIAMARARPGALNYAAGSVGGADHLSAELFKAMSSIDMVRIPYKSGGAAVIGLLGGEAQVSFNSSVSVAPHMKSGKLRALAVTSAQPSALAPGLPTVSAAGLPGYESVGMFGMFVPAKTPAILIERLNHEAVRVLDTAGVKEKFFNAGSEVVGSSAEQFSATVRAETAKWGKVFKDAGIKAE